MPIGSRNWLHATQDVHRVLRRHEHVQDALHARWSRLLAGLQQQLVDVQVAADDRQSLRMQQLASWKEN